MRTKVTALFYRLRAALRAEGLDLRAADSRKQKLRGVGQYYAVRGDSFVNKDVNLETLAQEMELFEPWETGGLYYDPRGRRAPSRQSQLPMIKRPRHSRSRSR
jgi:hypothetical protein